MTWNEISTLRLGVAVSNPGAQVFWRKMGYLETGETKRAGPDMMVDVIIMEKRTSCDGNV